MEYGLQLFSVRDVTERDMEGALRQVAEMGYRSVEFAGFFGHSAQEIKGWLDKYGLTASGTHTGMSELTGDKLQETIAYHQAIGCRNLIVPYESFATKGEIDAFIQRVQQVEPQLNAAGITLHYHNHDHEFKPNQDGLIPEEELLARTNLLLEVDTYWVYAAGKDPVAFLQEHKDRIRVIHLKDGKGGDACASLGQGIAPVAQVRQAAIQLGLEMVVGVPWRAGCVWTSCWWTPPAWRRSSAAWTSCAARTRRTATKIPPRGRQKENRERPALPVFAYQANSGFLGGQADEVLPSFHAAGAEDFHIPGLLAVAEHKGRGQGAAVFRHHLGVEGEQLVPPLDLVAHFGEALEAVALQLVGVHAHVDEELYALCCAKAQGVFGGKGKLNPGVSRGEELAPLWEDDHPRAQNLLGKGGVGTLGNRGHFARYGATEQGAFPQRRSRHSVSPFCKR